MITNELINFIKSELAKGKSVIQIKSELGAGGWNSIDLNEAFDNISKQRGQDIPLPPNGANVIKNKPHFKFLMIFIILFILGGIIFAGWYFFKPEISGLIEKITNKNIENKKTLIQTEYIKLLSPAEGDKVVAGSELIVKYEVLKDLPDSNYENIHFVAFSDISEEEDGCFEKIENKPIGVYSFSCKVNNNRIGPAMGSVYYLNMKQENDFSTAGLEEEYDKNNKKFQLEIIAPKKLKPVDILLEGYDFPSKINLLSISDGKKYFTAKIKYNDNSLREIPIEYLSYSFDDPTLLHFFNPNQIKYIYEQYYIAYREGTTVLHVEYNGIKKDFIINIIGELPEGRVPVRIDIGEEEQKIIDSLFSFSEILDKCNINNEDYYLSSVANNPDNLEGQISKLYDSSGKLVDNCSAVVRYSDRIPPDISSLKLESESSICKDVFKAFNSYNCRPIGYN